MTATTGSSAVAVPTGVLLRPLRWWDLPAVVAVDRVCFGRDAWSLETFLSELAQRPARDYAVLVGEGGDAPEDDGAVADAPDLSGRGGRAETAAGPDRRAEAARRPDRARGVLGYVGVALAGSRADLQTLAVAPAARGRGLGRLLLAHARTVAVERGARRLELEVRADNEPARALYSSAGFEVDGRRPGYYRDVAPGTPRVDAVLMHGDLLGSRHARRTAAGPDDSEAGLPR